MVAIWLIACNTTIVAVHASSQELIDTSNHYDSHCDITHKSINNSQKKNQENNNRKNPADVLKASFALSKPLQSNK